MDKMEEIKDGTEEKKLRNHIEQRIELLKALMNDPYLHLRQVNTTKAEYKFELQILEGLLEENKTQEKTIWEIIRKIIGLRLYRRFPKQVECPICKTDENKPCILIPICGTDDGEGHIEAHPFHITCLDLWYDNEDATCKFIFQKIEKK